MNNHSLQLILASASPRRRDLLDQVRVRYQAIAADIDESVGTGEDPGVYVQRMAAEKAREIMRRERSELPVLGADTSVIIDHHILGKPADRAEVVELLSLLSGRTHEVWSAVALILPGGEELAALNVTQVTFAELSASWVDAYIETGDSMDKAGAYGVQGLAAQQITRIDGSYSGVMGLPLYETCQLLRKAGVLNY